MLAGDVTGVWGVETLPDDGKGEAFQNVCFKEKECRHQMHNTNSDVYGIMMRGRRLIITENKCMGLAPHYVEEGQKLALLSCCSTPVLLSEIGDGSYKFAGTCFVQDWMEGEFFNQHEETEEEVWEAIDSSGRIRIV